MMIMMMMKPNTRRTRTPLLAIHALVVLLTKTMMSISAFQLVLPPTHRSIMPPFTTRKSSLSMAEKKKSKSTNGGGFGSFATTNNTNNKRARSISGKHTGAGTKALASAANTFDRIRKLYGKEGTTDVYVRSPKNDESIFWFVGKVVRMLDKNDDKQNVQAEVDSVDKGISAETNDKEIPQQQLLAGSVYPTITEAILSQKRLILEYAKCELRPQNMGLPQYAPHLELWMAPGDSEMDVARNHITLVKIEGSSKDLREGFNVNDVGYNPEIYVGEEKEKGGFRVVRDSEGRPVKPVFDISV